MADRPPISDQLEPAGDELAAEFEALESMLGFVPNAMRFAERRPDVVRAVIGMTRASLHPEGLDRQLADLVAIAASIGGGCTYCQAHTAFGAARGGIPESTIQGVFDAEGSPALQPRQRSALVFAREASRAPSAVSDAQEEAVRVDYSDDEIRDICGIVSMFGWLGRWNTALKVPLEPEPLAFAERVLAPVGWTRAPH